MKYSVHRKSSRLTKPLAAFTALERLLFAVDVSVIPQVVLSPERFATYITAVRPLISVGSLVNQKIVGLGELSITELTDELLLLPAGRPAA